MQGNVPLKILKRLECKSLLERLGFNLEAAQAVVCNHGYGTAKTFSCLKPNDIDVLVKTLCSPGREHNDRTKDQWISILHMAQHDLTLACFILFRQVCCDLCPIIYTINIKHVYNLDLQIVQEKEYSNKLLRKNCPKWDPADPEQSLINIREYFKSLCGSNGALCSYILQKDIVPLKQDL